MSIGDVHWVELPGTSGREQHGRRPAVVIQDDSVAASLPVVLVVPLTSSQAALRFPATTLISPTAGNGLAQPSVALVFQTRAIDRSRLREHLGNVEQAALDSIFEELDRLTGRLSP